MSISSCCITVLTQPRLQVNILKKTSSQTNKTVPKNIITDEPILVKHHHIMTNQRNRSIIYSNERVNVGEYKYNYRTYNQVFTQDEKVTQQLTTVRKPHIK